MSTILCSFVGGSYGGGGPPEIGEAFEGGFFAGYISTAANDVATHYLVVAPKSSGESTNTKWRTTGDTTSGTESEIDGPTNSANMNNTTHPAAYFCNGLTIGGYSDWYMPARSELEVCYYNLKPTTTSNTISIGSNSYAVPKRTSNYTTGTPAQTSATDFQSGNTEAFATVGYWSSTQGSMFTSQAFVTYFSNGNVNATSKATSFNVRAVRRVAV